MKALNGQYRFQTMGEYRALLSIYNLTVEEARGNVRGREYTGWSIPSRTAGATRWQRAAILLIGKCGCQAVQKKFVRSSRRLRQETGNMSKRTVLSVLQGTYDKDNLSQLKEKGIDTVLRYTEEGRIYGATFIDHRTGSVLNGSRIGKDFGECLCRNTSPCHTPDNRRYRYPSLWMLRTRHTDRPHTTVKTYRAEWACSLPKVRR